MYSTVAANETSKIQLHSIICCNIFKTTLLREKKLVTTRESDINLFQSRKPYTVKGIYEFSTNSTTHINYNIVFK